jgi:hypothetical protein
LQDLTVEDLIQPSGNSEEMDSFLQTVEEIEEFLQVFSDPYKEQAKTPAVPEPQTSMALTAPVEGSQHDSTQSQTRMMTSECSNIPGTVLSQNSTPPGTALEMPLGEPSATFSMNQQVASFDEIKPTADVQITDVTNIPKTLHTDCQKTTVTESKTTIPNEDNLMKTLSGNQTLSLTQMTALCRNEMNTVSDNHIFHGGQPAALKGDHVLTFSGDQMLIEDNTMTSSGNQNCGGQMATSGGGQTLSGDQMATPSGYQTLYGGHMTNSGGDQTLYGGQMTSPNSYQTLYGGQMTTYGGDQTVYRGQMAAPGSEQTLYGSQIMSFISNQTLCGSQMMTFGSDQILYGDHIMSHQSLSLPYPGFLYFPSSSLIQQPPPEEKWSLKNQSCQFQKNPDDLKPYICTYQDCGKSYSKSSHLRIHKRKHTGKRGPRYMGRDK